jgi:hypothetical protein
MLSINRIYSITKTSSPLTSIGYCYIFKVAAYAADHPTLLEIMGSVNQRSQQWIMMMHHQTDPSAVGAT